MFVAFVAFTGVYVLLIAAVSLLLLLIGIPRHRLRRIANEQTLNDNLNLLLAYGRHAAWLKLFPFMPVELSSDGTLPIDMRSLKISKYIRQFGEIGLELELPISFLQADLQPRPGNQKHLIAELCSRRSVRWREISDPPMPDARHLLYFDFGKNIDAVTEMLRLVLDSKGDGARIECARMQVSGIRRDRQILRRRVDRQEEIGIDEIRTEHLAALGPYSLAALAFGLLYSNPNWPEYTMQIGAWAFHIPSFDIFAIGVFALFLLLQQSFVAGISGWAGNALKLVWTPLRLFLLFLTLVNTAPRVLIQRLIKIDNRSNPVEQLSVGNLMSDTADRRLFALCAVATGLVLSLMLAVRWTTVN